MTVLGHLPFLRMVTALILASLVCIGCWPAHPSSTDLVGTWKVAHRFGTEILILAADGTYKQRLEDKDRTLRANQGRWRVEVAPAGRKLAGSRLVLEDAFIFATPFGDPEPKPSRGRWELEAVHEWGRMVLSFNPDTPGFVR
jgi:hypothetical protein